MRPAFLRMLIICIFTSYFSIAYAQDKHTITGNFEGYTFDRLITELQKTTGATFYYDPGEMDTLPIHINVMNATVSQVLDQLFLNTEFHYAIDPAGNIFISHHYNIRTTLPGSLFGLSRLKGRDTLLVSSTEEPEQAGKNQLKVSLENKLLEIGDKSQRSVQGKATIAGYIRDANTGEAIVGASIYMDTLSMTVVTDQFGYFSLTLPKGRHTIRFSSSGMKDARRQIYLYSDGKLNVDMLEYIASLKAVIVSAEKTSNTRSLQMGVNRLTIKNIKQVPVAFGEADVLKIVLTMPGVTSAGEASNGFNVRGGSTDQNLILFDEATVYNPSHLFGFFSAFNPDVVKGIELYKSAIPEKYGGRLSSVLDVSMLDGNSKKWSGTAGIGPLTSKLVIEGPLKKDKTTMIAGFRTTYSNWLLRSIHNTAYSNSTAGFYDANLRISHTINAKNSLYLMGYLSHDQFSLNGDTTYKYSNSNANIKWKHIFTNKHFALITAGIDRYRYSVSDTKNPVNGFKMGFGIDQTYFRSDFNYSTGSRHTLNYGFNTIFYKLHPGYLTPFGAQSLVASDNVPAEQGLESALYLGDQYALSSRFSINAGLRFSVFNYLGPHDVYGYTPGLPKRTSTIDDTASYSGGKFIKTYMAPEIRLAARYTITDNASLKLSFNTLQQYIHMLSNTVTISPTDIWKLSDPHIKPQQGRQYSLGFYRNFKANTIETSLEVYYKQLDNYLDYKSGAELVLNHHIETDVISTKGKAYGIELLLKKISGQLNGWFSYTYSRTFLKQDDPLAGETINKGKYYPASFDKPHNLNFITNYRFSHRYSLSLNVVYSTGRPITLPLAVFNLGGSPGLYYSQRNQFRIPDYFRSDISVNIDGNHKVKKPTHNSWSAGIYNLTGRQNAYSVYFTQENGSIKGYKLSIFGTLIPFVTYNLKF